MLSTRQGRPFRIAGLMLGRGKVANNLHVSYDLIAPEKNYDAVIEAVKSLGGWAKIHKSFWYVDSKYTASQAVDIIKRAADANDKIYVVDATNNNASWVNLGPEAAAYIQQHWNN